MSNKWLNNIGRIIKKKDGGYFLVFERQKDADGNYRGEDPFPLTVNEGDIFQLKKKEDDLAGLVEMEKMTQETADKIAKVVRFEVSKAPDKEEKKSDKAKGKAKSKSKSGNDDDDEINF